MLPSLDRTKTINLGLGLDRLNDKTEEKSRNTASRTQDRRTCQGPQTEESFYRTATDHKPMSKSRAPAAGNRHESATSSAKKKPPVGDKLKRIRVNLMGSGCSRNGLSAKTGTGNPQVERALGHLPHFSGPKRAYVASLLQPSASLKK